MATFTKSQIKKYNRGEDGKVARWVARNHPQIAAARLTQKAEGALLPGLSALAALPVIKEKANDFRLGEKDVRKVVRKVQKAFRVPKAWRL